ncbi:MAG: class I SAM-dependent methyltransferase [Chloroflexota bacterium]|nr:class I SAM-dependent methyltransferase [Chloroflexota bacterium]
MRSLKHWTARYVFDRSCSAIDEWRHPEDPWLTRQAINLLESLLRASDEVLEFGSGRSTIWFARRVASVVTVEDDPAWHQEVGSRLTKAKLQNVEQILCGGKPAGGDNSVSDTALYMDVLQQFPDRSIDIVLVDGQARAVCATGSLPKMRPGGLLILDNAEWFLPSTTRAPGARRSNAEARDAWIDFEAATASWRRVWTTNGVFDTVIWFKP